MKNKLQDLNDHLFAQLERLSDEDQSSEQLKAEIERSKAMTSVANAIISNGKLVLDAQREYSNQPKGAANEMLLGHKNEDQPNSQQKP